MRRPLIVTLVAVLFCVVTIVLLFATVLTYLPSLLHTRSTAGAAAATGRVALTILSTFSACIVVGLFRFRRWAVTCAGIAAGLCANYAIAVLLVGHAGPQALTWILMLGSLCLAWRLLWKIAPTAASGDAAGTRPLGIKFLAGLAATSLLLAPTLIRSDFKHQAPRWQIASHIFNFALCAVLSFGLWNLREWARVLTEVTSLFSPAERVAFIPRDEQTQAICYSNIDFSVNVFSVVHLVSKAGRHRSKVRRRRLSHAH